MVNLFGTSGNYLLFTDGNSGVIIDTATNTVDATGSIESLSYAMPWAKEDIAASSVAHELAHGALADLRVQSLTASARLYTIPKAAQEEAKRGLAWRKEHKRGGTPVGVNSARTLAAGGQIGLEKVRHIAKYFPRHEVDKKGKGYRVDEEGYPSAGRIAWALWGGDAAWRWASAIVERENKNAVTSAGYVNVSTETDLYALTMAYDADLDAFKQASLADEGGPEFAVRVSRADDTIDRLYLIGEEGEVSVWDAKGWDTLGQSDNDIFSCDRTLDEPDYFDASAEHYLVDYQSALSISAQLQQNPFTKISVASLDPEEYEVYASGKEEVNWDFIDAITAAGEESIGGTTAGPDDGYTPEERSQKARKQVRDKGGKFAKMGGRVVVNSDSTTRGAITGIDGASGNVVVKLDSGVSVQVPANQTQDESSFENPNDTQGGPSTGAPLDTSGILGKPRTPIDRPNAKIPGTLPALTPNDLQSILYNFPAWVKQQRDSAGSDTSVETGRPVAETKADWDKQREDYYKKREKETGTKYKFREADLRDHPLTKKLFTGSNKKNNLYYNPIRGSAPADAVARPEPQGIGEPLTPETSDVQPLYMAIVSPEDPSAVFDLICLIPANSKSVVPTIFKRADSKWVQDDKILADLTSATPPPVVPLSGSALDSTLQQLDGLVASALLAEGGLDRNRGKAEKLRHYWLYGRGAIKIRWNTPGDWTRCYRHLMKYMGPRAKGYCALRHKEATGFWPGSKYNVGKKNIRGSAALEATLLSEEAILEKLFLHAAAHSARNRVILAAGAYEINENTVQPASTGAKFSIPLVIPEGVETGDGRIFNDNAITIRELPLPLLWQIETADGHNGSVVVGRIDHMERIDGGIGLGTGVFDTSPHGKEAERMVREGFIRGVSADLDKFEAEEEKEKEIADIELAKKKAKKIGGDKINITQARVMAVTIVPKPAFEECAIYIVNSEENGNNQEEIMESLPDGIYIDDDIDPIDAQSLVACGILAGAIPTVPPADWFTDPKLTGPTPLSVDDLGRVFGHIASWQTDHIGMSRGTRAPKSRSGYAYFHTGVIRADDGKDYAIGQLTLAGGHASLEASAVDAARHYDDTGSAIADVHAGEDQFGIWVAGALRPGATPEQIRALRASAPSGDWRPIGGQLELVAVCQVNVPGFPIARARVASGQVYALVAAGAAVLAKMKNDPLTELSQRIETLESKERLSLNAEVDALRSRMADAKVAKHAQLTAKAKELANRIYADEVTEEELETLGYISREKRQKLAAEKKALPDGSYPIVSVDDLKNAIQAYGRSKPGKRSAVRRHIVRRARGLDQADLIPDKWKEASVLQEDAAEIRARVASAKEGLLATMAVTSENTEKTINSEALFSDKYVSGVNQPRDSKGMFRTVLARLKEDLGASGLQDVVEKVEDAEGLDNAGNYDAAIAAAQDLLGVIDRLDSGALDATALESVRSTARSLGQVISNLPLAFGADAQKVRYSDLPPVLRNLIDEMVKRVEKKIGQKDADEVTKKLKNYQSGGDMYSQSEVSSEMSTLLRLLT